MKGKRKGKGQGDPGAAMAYMRRLHGDPDYAPVGDLADLAESKQTTDAPPALERQEKKRKFAL